MSELRAAASPLWQEIRARGMTTLAVMGMTKNTGKTVCLNHLLAAADAHDTAVGITSIGRDGEDRDQVFSIPKPPVRVAAGALVATARDTLLRARVRWKQIGGTGIDSPMGEIVVVRAQDDGEMEIAGASRSRDQQRVIGLLRQCGAALVILDGALGRSHHASPAIADGVVLATGAAIGGGIDDVIRKTRDRLAILGIGEAGESLAAQVRAVFEQGGVGVWNGAGDCLFDARIATLNAAPRLLEFASDDVATIAVSGAVGRALWQALDALALRHPGLTLVVADGTRLFVDAHDVAAFARRGGRLVALRGIRIAGIALNPSSPFGGGFDAEEFLRAARRAFPARVVSDVVLASDPRIEGALP